ncbi:Rieske 2Fe-2S domain-containing protein [uncultured Rhodoblastus sp.]|uniref:Rieske (2Fe-2S) protein n=1 Tax=uncultured Rhodoblastus sp. TaxID=543037 RepID=UPI0025FBF050|nr:Rieske 2Fe-2S domain-containing protein [uncultured Rhodoblastus sp.]
MSEAGEETIPGEVFVICGERDIARGQAKAFDLAESDGSGGSKPFRIVIARNDQGAFHAYRNACPHQGVWLNIGSGKFLDETGALLQCGRHGAKFAIETGTCLSGACEGAQLEKVRVLVLDGDVCIHGVALVEEDFAPRHDDDLEDTMEITIHP